MAVYLVSPRIFFWLMLCLSYFLCWWQISWDCLIDHMRIMILLNYPRNDFVLRLDDQCRISFWSVHLKVPLSIHCTLIWLVDKIIPFRVCNLNSSCFWKFELNGLTHPTLNLMLIKWLISLCWFVFTNSLNECSMRKRMVESHFICVLLMNRSHIWKHAREVLCVWSKDYSSLWRVICLSFNIRFANFTDQIHETIIGVCDYISFSNFKLFN